MKFRSNSIRSATLVLLFALTESRLLKATSGHGSPIQQVPQRSDLSVQNVFDYTYGDSSYDDDERSARNGRGYVIRSQNKIRTEDDRDEDDRDEDDYQRRPIKNDLVEGRSPHVVVDDESNYDYTYGDPEVDYDYRTDTSNEKDSDEDHHESDEEASNEDPSPDDKTAKDPANEDRKMVTQIVASVFEWLIRNWEKAKVIREEWRELKTDVQMRWKRIKHNMTRIKNSLQGIFNKFGIEIQMGLKYCLIKIKVDDQTIEIEASEALQKLERFLNEGSKIVAAFFKLLGEKSQGMEDAEYVGIARRPPSRDNMKSASYSYGGPAEENGNQNTLSSTNLFEDSEVLQKLNSLVEGNVLSREEADAIIKAAAQQTERARGGFDHRSPAVL